MILFFMLRPSALNKGEIVVMNRAHIDYEKLEVLTQRENAVYEKKMSKNLKYSIMENCIYQTKKKALWKYGYNMLRSQKY